MFNRSVENYGVEYSKYIDYEERKTFESYFTVVILINCNLLLIMYVNRFLLLTVKQSYK
jgi:hypothetical protein